MPVCPGCGRPVEVEGIYCRDCIIKSREEAYEEPDDFSIFDDLEKRAGIEKNVEVNFFADDVEDLLIKNLKKTILKYRSSQEPYELDIAKDAYEKLGRLLPEDHQLLNALSPDH